MNEQTRRAEAGSHIQADESVPMAAWGLVGHKHIRTPPPQGFDILREDGVPLAQSHAPAPAFGTRLTPKVIPAAGVDRVRHVEARIPYPKMVGNKFGDPP